MHLAYLKTFMQFSIIISGKNFFIFYNKSSVRSSSTIECKLFTLKWKLLQKKYYILFLVNIVFKSKKMPYESLQNSLQNNKTVLKLDISWMLIFTREQTK